MNRFILFIFIVLHTFNLFGVLREDTIKLNRSYGLQLSGFARVDYVYDTRQTSEAVEGLFTFYPLNKQLDEKGKDLNASPKANLLSIATRFCSRFYAPDLFNAKSTAYVEFDFSGTSNTNGVRLRQAYANLAWEKVNLLMGRTWHPLSTYCIPNMIALNTGAPFWAFNRSDQLRIEYKPEHWLISAFAVYQSDYASSGPSPGSLSIAVKNSTYMRDAVLPEFAVHVAHKASIFQTGVVGTVKSIKPRQYTMPDYNPLKPSAPKYKTDEKLTTYVAQAYAQIKTEKLSLKAQAIYTQNTTESLMIGGYAVCAIDSITGHEKYTPTQYMNYWVNIDYGKKWQAGLFAGYLNSLGTLDNVTGPWFARGNEIKYMYRISPHIFYNMNNWQFATEVEYTVAAFGEIQNEQKAKIVNAKEVGNFRTNVLICFFF